MLPDIDELTDEKCFECNELLNSVINDIIGNVEITQPDGNNIENGETDSRALIISLHFLLRTKV